MKTFSIAIHGGAENLEPSEVSEEKQQQYKKGLEEALQAGWEILHNNGCAVDAVVAAVKVLEDNPLFNAGKGSSITQKGEIEFNSSVMDGKTLKAGAAGAVRFVKNPVDLARCIMDKCEHNFLAGAGAEEFAIKHHLPMEEQSYFFTKEKEDQWLEQRKQNKLSGHDTVGAVALDQDGNLAAATSTGGLTFQLKGRVSDGPMLGCGTLAINDVCAVACTGEGEVIMRGVLAHEVYALAKYAGKSIQEAADGAIKLYDDRLQGDKGLIAMDGTGKVAFAFNTTCMKRASRTGNDAPFVELWRS